MDADYAKYGSVRGAVQPGTGRLVCGIICSGWPSWALAAECRGREIKLVIIKDSFWSPKIIKLFPRVPVLRCEECENRLTIGVQVSVWFSDVDPPRRLRLFEAEPRPVVVTLRRAQQLPVGEKQFAYHWLSLQHSDCGVTGGFFCVSRNVPEKIKMVAIAIGKLNFHTFPVESTVEKV
jgi:hypothetical protein